jgi:hypothetical protein
LSLVHRDGKIFASLPRSGQVNAAQMHAERGDCRQAHAGPGSVDALAGVTPVTKESSKHRDVSFRWACNKRFRRAVTTFAGNGRHASPWAAKACNDARAAGKDRCQPTPAYYLPATSSATSCCAHAGPTTTSPHPSWPGCSARGQQRPRQALRPPTSKPPPGRPLTTPP